MSAAREIIWLKEIDKLDRHLVGEKGVVLGELTRNKFPVKNGFVVTPVAGEQFISQINQQRIEGRLLALKGADSKEKETLIKEIKKIIRSTGFSGDLERQIIQSFVRLTDKESSETVVVRPVRVAVGHNHQIEMDMRSRYAKGEAQVLEMIRDVWAEGYMEMMGGIRMSVGVIVQAVGDIQAAGRMLTVNPVTGEKNSLVIEVGNELLEMKSGGLAKQDFFEVNKHAMEIVGGRPEDILTRFGFPKRANRKQRLTEKQVLALAKLGMDLEHHYAAPQVVEWSLTAGVVSVMDVKPLMSLRPGERKDLPEDERVSEATRHLQVISNGLPASRGLVSGYARLIIKQADLKSLKRGEIAVVSSLEKEWLPLLKRARGLVLEDGDLVSRGAMMSRELGLPCIIGAPSAVKIVKTGWLITVDGWSGKVYRGGVKLRPNRIQIIEPEITETKALEVAPLKTAVKIFGCMNELNNGKVLATKPCDGVYLEANSWLKNLGVHPKEIVEQGRSQQVVEYLSDAIVHGCRVLAGRQVIYMTSDLWSNDYRQFRGARLRETAEVNPLLGYHGVLRHVRDNSVFDWETRAVKRVRNKLGYKNVQIALTGIRHLKNLLEIKKQMAGVGLTRTASLKLWLVVETPGMVASIKRMAKGGIDGVIVDVDRLSQLWQGLDKDNEAVNRYYNPDDPTLDWTLESLIKICHKLGLQVGVWYRSNLPSNRIIHNLISWGVEIVGVREKGVNYIREVAAEAEKRLVNK